MIFIWGEITILYGLKLLYNRALGLLRLYSYRDLAIEITRIPIAIELSLGFLARALQREISLESSMVVAKLLAFLYGLKLLVILVWAELLAIFIWAEITSDSYMG